MKCISLILCIAIAISGTSARLTIRHRRQVEREDAASSSGASELPASEVVVIKDTINPSLPGPLFLVPRLPGPGDAFDLDINEQDGTFSFGGQLPSHFHHHHMGHQSFAGLFDAIQRRFDEMTRNMMSFNNFGPGFSPTTDISSLPDDYNKTDSEIVELNGHRYVKKTTTLKKGGPGATFFVRSTTFERVNENENADVPAPGAEEDTDKKDKPVIGGGAEDGVESEGPKVEESVPVPSNASSDSEPKVPDEPSSSPAPSSSSTSSEAPAVSESSPDVPAASPDETDAKDKNNSPNNESNETDEREREDESLPSSSSSSTTEQP